MTLTDIRRALSAAGIDNAASEARMLAAHYTGYSVARLLTMGTEELSAPGLAEAVERRCRREPLQYILGEWPFMGLPFALSPDCLIPRPDTETLVEAALTTLPPGARVADLCTGSGCIGIAMAHARPDISVTAVELSPGAAEMARRNAKRLEVADRFTVLLGDVTKSPFPAGTEWDTVVANPPYITREEMEDLEAELSFEPRMALTDEGDGLSVIRGVLAIAARTLTDTGHLYMEFGAAQGAAVLTLAAAYGLSGRILPDLGGRDRVLSAQRTTDYNRGTHP